jgi:DNA repair protein RadC
MARRRARQLTLFEDYANTLTRSDRDIVVDAIDVLDRTLRRPGVCLSSPNTVADYLKLTLSPRPHEVFAVLFLDNRHRLIEAREMFRGTIDGSSVYPREVVKTALALNSAAVILAHNHPSGVAEPSAADEVITQRVRDALSLIDVRVIDHFIVARTTHVSMAQRGLLCG